MTFWSIATDTPRSTTMGSDPGGGRYCKTGGCGPTAASSKGRILLPFIRATVPARRCGWHSSRCAWRITSSSGRERSGGSHRWQEVSEGEKFDRIMDEIVGLNLGSDSRAYEVIAREVDMTCGRWTGGGNSSRVGGRHGQRRKSLSSGGRSDMPRRTTRLPRSGSVSRRAFGRRALRMARRGSRTGPT